MTKKFLSVHEVAKLTGITARTLHYYDEIGLLKPTKVTEAGYRIVLAIGLELMYWKDVLLS